MYHVFFLNGVVVTNADNKVSVDVDGPAELIGLESGDAFSHEDYKSKERKAYNGRLLAYIQSSGKAGEATVIVKCAGLRGDTIIIRSQKGTNR